MGLCVSVEVRMPGRRSESDKRMSAYLKDIGEERTSGRCAVCYRFIPNDTKGGSGAFNHYPAQCINARTGKQGRLRKI